MLLPKDKARAAGVHCKQIARHTDNSPEVNGRLLGLTLFVLQGWAGLAQWTPPCGAPVPFLGCCLLPPGCCC